MRWEDERYVRLYTRDTPEEIALSWEAAALWRAMLRKFDRAGLIELGRAGIKGLAGLVRIPVDVVERTLPELLDDGRIRQVGTTIVAPNFIEANETPQSDRLRRQMSRERARDSAMPSRNVTADAGDVTRGHTTSLRTVPCSAEPCSTLPDPDPVPTEPVRSDAPPSSPPAVAPERLGQESQKPKRRRKPPAPPKPDLPIEAVSPLEREIADAIADDPDLAPICPRPRQTARDLTRAGPAVDVALEVRKAGGWLRANPAKRKTKGAKFLLGWVIRTQERGGTPGYRPPEPWELRPPPAPPPPCPEVLAMPVGDEPIDAMLDRIGRGGRPNGKPPEVTP